MPACAPGWVFNGPALQVISGAASLYLYLNAELVVIPSRPANYQAAVTSSSLTWSLERLPGQPKAPWPSHRVDMCRMRVRKPVFGLASGDIPCPVGEGVG